MAVFGSRSHCKCSLAFTGGMLTVSVAEKFCSRRLGSMRYWRNCLAKGFSCLRGINRDPALCIHGGGAIGPENRVEGNIGVLGLTQRKAGLLATGVLNFLAGVAPFLPCFRRRQALVLVEVFAVRDRHGDVKPRQGDPA